MRTIVALRKTCDVAPSQWEGTIGGGDAVYMRFRHGQFSIDVNGERVVTERLSDNVADSYMSDRYMIQQADAAGFAVVCYIADETLEYAQ